MNQEKEFKAGGEFMFDLLAKANLRFDTYYPLYGMIDAAIAYLSGGGNSLCYSITPSHWLSVFLCLSRYFSLAVSITVFV